MWDGLKQNHRCGLAAGVAARAWVSDDRQRQCRNSGSLHAAFPSWMRVQSSRMHFSLPGAAGPSLFSRPALMACGNIDFVCAYVDVGPRSQWWRPLGSRSTAWLTTSSIASWDCLHPARRPRAAAQGRRVARGRFREGDSGACAEAYLALSPTSKVRWRAPGRGLRSCVLIPGCNRNPRSWAPPSTPPPPPQEDNNNIIASCRSAHRPLKTAPVAHHEAAHGSGVALH